MLYISRLIGSRTWGIVDTDDGTEERATVWDIQHYCVDLGMHIEGVTLDTRTVKMHNKYTTQTIVSKVEIYQNPEFVSGNTARLRMLKGVDVSVFNGEITQVRIDDNMIDKGISIRLSDYGKVCGKRVFRNMPFSGGLQEGVPYTAYLRVIVDDKIELSAQSLDDFAYKGVCLDFREVTNANSINRLVQSVIKFKVSPLVFSNNPYIIASPDVLDYVKGCLLVNRYNYDIVDTIGIFENEDAVVEKLTKKYLNEFRRLATSDFILVKPLEGGQTTRSIEHYVTFVQQHRDKFYNPTVDTYSSYMDERFYEMLGTLGMVSTCSPASLNRFINFVKFFDAPLEIQEAYVTFILNASRWLTKEVDRYKRRRNAVHKSSN